MDIDGSTIKRSSRSFFGFGLSYTSFEMSGITAAPASDGGATVTLRIKNTGSVAGDEVPQIYLDAPSEKPAGVQFVPKTLVAFDRATLKPGEEREITFHVAPRAFQYWSTTTNAWVRASAERTLRAGSSSRDLPLSVFLR